MRGLVIEKVYLRRSSRVNHWDIFRHIQSVKATNNSKIVEHISAMVFLATLHRGAAFAATLNNIFKASPGGNAKTYVAELERQFDSLQDISEQFRTVCGNLELVSLHKTLRTGLRPSPGTKSS